jgi:hypothetical protein
LGATAGLATAALPLLCAGALPFMWLPLPLATMPLEATFGAILLPSKFALKKTGTKSPAH